MTAKSFVLQDSIQAAQPWVIHILFLFKITVVKILTVRLDQPSPMLMYYNVLEENYCFTFVRKKKKIQKSDIIVN